MNSLSHFAGSIGTIVAALVGGGITYLVAVFTKESKVSEFRQNWIDGLREDAAKFIGIWYYVAAELELVPSAEFSTREFWRSMKDEFMQMEVLQARIVLRLNPEEHSSVIEQLKFLANGESLTGLTHSQRVAEISSFSDDVQKILKGEWARVKKGENTYRFVKTASKIVLIVAFLALAIAGLAHLAATQGAP